MEENEIMNYVPQAELRLMGSVMETIEQAKEAAKALQEHIFAVVPPAVFHGQKYPLVEHWQTIGSFYGVVARITSTEYVEFGEVRGWQAVAEAVRVHDGFILSRAEAMCMTDEPNWAKKPMHQLRAMAQVRAISRAMRNIFARIMVLAGVNPTPAEDIGVEYPRRQKQPLKQNQSHQEGFITEKQQKFLFAKARELGRSNEEVKEILASFGFSATAEIPKDQFDAVLEALAAS